MDRRYYFQITANQKSEDFFELILAMKVVREQLVRAVGMTLDELSAFFPAIYPELSTQVRSQQ